MQAGEVRVRFVRTGAFDDPDRSARALATLGADERTAYTRLRSRDARCEYLAAHVLVRETLAEVVGCDPSRLELVPSSRGGPRLTAPHAARDLRFSLSRADGIALCAVAEGQPVGADVESLTRLGDSPLDLVDILCTSREREEIAAAPDAERAARILSLWVVKEAVVKATGAGVRLPFSRFDARKALRGWHLASAWLTPRHMTAIAVRIADRADAVIRFEEAG